MLLEQGLNCQEMSSDQVSLSGGSNVIVTHASDSDSTGEGQPNSALQMQSFSSNSNREMMPSTGHHHHHHRQAPAKLSRFAPQSSPSSSSTTNNRNGFFIEI